MASLAAALAARVDSQAVEERSRRSDRPRLVADPLMSVADLTRVLVNYMSYHRSADLWSLVAPPPQACLSFSWKTPPQPLWLSKCCGLLYELLDVAPNTKVASSKLLLALRTILKDKSLTVPQGVSAADHLDKIDCGIRTLLAMLRTLSESPATKARCLRMLANRDQMQLQMTLAKVNIPPEYRRTPSQDRTEDDEEEGCRNTALQLVPLPAGSPGQTPSPTNCRQEQPKRVATLAPAVPLRPLHEVSALFDNMLGLAAKPLQTDPATSAAGIQDQDLRGSAQVHRSQVAASAPAALLKRPAAARPNQRPASRRNKQGHPAAEATPWQEESQQEDSPQEQPQPLEGHQVEADVYARPRHEGIALDLQLRHKYGCGKCRRAPWCTPSCYRYRGEI